MPSHPPKGLIIALGICFGIVIVGSTTGTALAVSQSATQTPIQISTDMTDSVRTNGAVFQQENGTTTGAAENGTTTPQNNTTTGSVQNNTATTVPDNNTTAGERTATTTQKRKAEKPDIGVTNLQINRSKAPVDGGIKVTLIVENKGTVAGSKQITVESLGKTTKRAVSLDAGESTKVTWVASYPTTGNYIIRSDGKTARVSVFSENADNKGGESVVSGDNTSARFEVVSFDTTNTTVDIKENVTITAVIENTGGERGKDTVMFKRSGEVVRTREISLNPSSSTKVEFSTGFSSPGAYTVSVAGREVSITVERGLDRGGGIGVDTSPNGTGQQNSTTTANEGDGNDITGEQEENSSAESGGSSGSGGGGIKWFALGMGLIGVVVIGFAALEGYARYIR